MTGPHGTKQDPRYTLQDGLELRLRPLKALLLDRWRIDYKKKFPPPQPPVIVLDNDDLWKNAKDPWYLELKADYDEQLNNALAEFLFSHGVRNDPPEDWEPFFDEDNLSLRYMWLSEILDADDISGLMNAIMGIDMPTPEGIEDAEKKSTPAGEENL